MSKDSTTNWSELRDEYFIRRTEVLFLVVLEYGTVKSFAIRLRGVKLPKMSQNTSVSFNFQI